MSRMPTKLTMLVVHVSALVAGIAAGWWFFEAMSS